MRTSESSPPAPNRKHGHASASQATCADTPPRRPDGEDRTAEVGISQNLADNGVAGPETPRTSPYGRRKPIDQLSGHSLGIGDRRDLARRRRSAAVHPP